jgi:RNA recognition motif-containing protein/exosome complex RNA-binding protein Csl4
MTTDIITPGADLGTSENRTPGAGVIEENGRLVATLVGTVNDSEGVVSIGTEGGIIRPEVGDTVIAVVSRINEKNGEATLLAICDKPERGFLPNDQFVQFHVTDICDRYLHHIGDALRRRDLIRATVSQAEPIVKITMKKGDENGVLWALCPACGDVFEADGDGDWKVRCPTCDEQTFRALADDYLGGEGLAALNKAGKRWSPAAEKVFARGPSGRATFIAADVRNDGRERNYFRFEAESGGRGGGGGRRNQHTPGCKLFVGGLPFSVDTDSLRKMFATHGDINDCIVICDEGGKSKGFGFVTFDAKEHADAAIKALDRSKVDGRRIGVRDSDAPRDKKPDRKHASGARLYVGNLPFKATEDELKALFTEHCKVTGLDWTRDKAGQPKAFAFITIQPESDAAAIIEKVNGSELKGRKIRVDSANSGGSKKIDKDGGSSEGAGKSSRELQAIQEENSDGKKRKSGPHKPLSND